LQAVQAGKHVLIEKPLGITVEECIEIKNAVLASNIIFQIGNNRRFEPGLAEAHRFVKEELGQVHTYEGWYFDSIYRYTMQHNLYPGAVHSSQTKKLSVDPKLNRQRYTLITHGAHIVDTARFLVGKIVRVLARHRAIGNAQGWSIEIEFEDGCLGHLNLISPRHGDFEEGFRIHGQHGMAQGVASLPWYQQAKVECFKNGQYKRLLGEDGLTFKRQVEGFSDTILKGIPQHGANVLDGLEAVKALVAISISTETGNWVDLDSVTGEVRAPNVHIAPSELPQNKVKVA
jgi:predicted dehydrogenase